MSNLASEHHERYHTTEEQLDLDALERLTGTRLESGEFVQVKRQTLRALILHLWDYREITRQEDLNIRNLEQRLREAEGQEAVDETLKEAKEIVDDPYTYGARVARIVHEMTLDRAHFKTRIAQLEADFKLAKQVAESEAERANKLERVREAAKQIDGYNTDNRVFAALRAALADAVEEKP